LDSFSRRRVVRTVIEPKVHYTPDDSHEESKTDLVRSDFVSSSSINNCMAMHALKSPKHKIKKYDEGKETRLWLDSMDINTTM
jgi:hypothetical protein